MEDVLLQTVPEFFDRPYGRLLLAAIVIGAVLLIGRVLLSIAWKLVLIAVLVLAVLFAANFVGVA